MLGDRSVLTKISELHQKLHPLLVSAGVVYPDEELALILEAAAGLPSASLQPSTELTPQAASEVGALVRRRAGGEPLHYVTGTVDFRSLRLAIGPGAFIPRPGTVAVVDRAEAALPRDGLVVDVCTGCGAIALAIASERPDATVYGSDMSGEALAWAEDNRRRTGLEVTFLLGDLFYPLPADLRGRIDVIVSNPPHVPLSEARFLPRDVADHEPAESLFAGPDGLLVIKRLASEGVGWLRPEGWLVCEVGDSQCDEVTRQLRLLGYADVAIHLDESHRRRVVEARWPASKQVQGD
jgi:release factor glutamine methyltransferase